jgi:ABC-2 type transport system ATP-binding protein
MLEAVHLTKRYSGVTALDDLTLSILPGDVFCLLGANGAGKTTTINLFLNFVEPTSGTARINGIDVKEQPLETKKYLAYIPETVMLYKNLTGLENLEYFSALAGHPDYTRMQLLDFLHQVGLDASAADKRVGVYSKGMRQKVGIAIALAKNAKALLLDEPTSGLDPKAANEFSSLLTRLSREGVAVLMATHDLFRAKESGTRVGIMKHGRLVRALATDEVGHADLERIYLEHMHD